MPRLQLGRRLHPGGMPFLAHLRGLQDPVRSLHRRPLGPAGLRLGCPGVRTRGRHVTLPPTVWELSRESAVLARTSRTLCVQVIHCKFTPRFPFRQTQRLRHAQLTCRQTKLAKEAPRNQAVTFMARHGQQQGTVSSAVTQPKPKPDWKRMCGREPRRPPAPISPTCAVSAPPRRGRSPRHRLAESTRAIGEPRAA